MVDTDMPDAPDLVEDSDDSMLDVEMADLEVDTDMADAVSSRHFFFFLLPFPLVPMATTDLLFFLPSSQSYEPLLCQGSPVPALPAPLLYLPSVSTALADTAMEMQQQQPLLSLPETVVAHPVLAPVPAPGFAAFDNTAVGVQQGGVAWAPKPVTVSVSFPIKAILLHP